MTCSPPMPTRAAWQAFRRLLDSERAARRTRRCTEAVMNFLTEIVAFVVAIGVLVVVHEFGHYSVARLCGVKVLRFSVGFGKPLVKWVSKSTGTEWTIAALPLGGYVKMLDEREARSEHSRRGLAARFQPPAGLQADRDCHSGSGGELHSRHLAVCRPCSRAASPNPPPSLGACARHRCREGGFRGRRDDRFDARRAGGGETHRSARGPICAGSCSTRRSIIVAWC